MMIQLGKPHPVKKERKVYERICANPDCLKDFVTPNKSTIYCRRGCQPHKHTKGLVAPSHDEPLPVDERGFFDASAFCRRYYEDNRPQGGVRYGDTTIHVLSQK